jgi:2,4-dienoyl-CoA reductase-like NADH-dependent reductase (Old Yellow Enzyme family)
MCSASDGVPTEELVDFHVNVVAGGAAMTTIAYASVSHDGRSFPTQICLSSPSSSSASSDKDFNTSPLSRTKNVLTRLCDACHAHGGKVSIQLTHAGAFADPSFNDGATAKGPSAIFNPLTMTLATPLEPDDMDRIESVFVNAVDCCKAIGFDAVEIHLGHGYLLSQFLSARTNPKYANNPDKRLEFPLRVLKAVCDRAHSTNSAANNNSNNNDNYGTGNDLMANGKPNQSKWLAVLVKYNVSELLERDLPWSHIVKFTRAFHDAGADLLVPSGGHVMVSTSCGLLDHIIADMCQYDIFKFSSIIN